MRVSINHPRPSAAYLTEFKGWLAEHNIDKVLDYDESSWGLSSFDTAIKHSDTIKVFQIYVDIPEDDVAAECFLRFS